MASPASPSSAPSTPSSTDPALPSSSNANHTTKSNTKPTSALSALTDPTFAPTLESAPAAHRAKSYLLLVSLVVGGIAGTWYYGFELFQIQSRDASWLQLGGTLSLAVLLVVGLLFLTGTANVDFWTLAMEYGRWTIPVVAAVGFLLVMMLERTEGLKDVD